MAAKTPIRAVYTGANATGLAEFQSGEFVDYTFGGTGLAALGSANQVLATNSGTSAIEWQTISADITAVTAGTGLSGGGTSGTVTLTADLTASSTTTLTNKTLTSPKINEDVVMSATATELNYSDLATLGTSAASKVLSADANNLSKITGAIYIEEATLTFDVTQDWDVRTSPVAKVTLTNNVTFDAPSNPTTGQFISIVCIQDGTGSRTIAWNAVFEFATDTAPVATTTAAKGDMFNFRYNGAKWLEVGRNLALTLA